MTEKKRQVVHAPSGRLLINRARWCDSFLSRMRGFTFKRKPDPGEGLVLVYDSDSRIDAAITMLFVNFDLGVVWVDGSGRVVDTKLARSWHLSYAPQGPARFVVESDPGILEFVDQGDIIEFIEIPSEPKA